nr:hypothetical protein [Tanacetum cinerariifolium]
MDLRWQLSLLSMRAKRECKAQMNQDGQFRSQDNTRKQESDEDTSLKSMLAINGVGFDWSDMAKKTVSEDTSSFVESPLNVDKETAISVDKKIEFVKPKNYDKPVRKSV